MSIHHRNSVLNIAGEGLWGMGMGLVTPMTVLVLLLKDHGAGPRIAGLLVAIQTVLMVLPQLLGAYLFHSRRTRKRTLVLWHSVMMVPWLLIFAALAWWSPALTPTLVRWAVVACFALQTLSVGLIVTVWTDWIAHLFGPELRGKVWGLAIGLSSLGAMGSAVVAGRVLDALPGPAGYTLLYLMATTLTLASMGLFAFIHDPAGDWPEEPPRTPLHELFGKCLVSLRHGNYQRYLLGRFMASLGFAILPFITLYYSSPEGGGLQKGQVVGYAAAIGIGTAAASAGLGWLGTHRGHRLGTHRGHRLGAVLGVAMQAAALVVLITSQGPVSCVLAFLLAGLGTGGATISHLNLMVETCPHDHRQAHFFVGNVVMAIGGATAPLIGGWAAEVFGLRALFQASLVISLLALLWLVLLVQEPRRLAMPKAMG